MYFLHFVHYFFCSSVSFLRAEHASLSRSAFRGWWAFFERSCWPFGWGFCPCSRRWVVLLMRQCFAHRKSRDFWARLQIEPVGKIHCHDHSCSAFHIFKHKLFCNLNEKRLSVVLMGIRTSGERLIARSTMLKIIDQWSSFLFLLDCERMDHLI